MNNIDVAKEIAEAIRKTLGGYELDNAEGFTSLGDYAQLGEFFKNLSPEVVKEIASNLRTEATEGGRQVIVEEE